MKRRSFLKSILAAACVAVSVKLDILTPDVTVVEPEPSPMTQWYGYQTIGFSMGHTEALAKAEFL